MMEGDGRGGKSSAVELKDGTVWERDGGRGIETGIGPGTAFPMMGDGCTGGDSGSVDASPTPETIGWQLLPAGT